MNPWAESAELIVRSLGGREAATAQVLRSNLIGGQRVGLASNSRFALSQVARSSSSSMRERAVARTNSEVLAFRTPRDAT